MQKQKLQPIKYSRIEEMKYWNVKHTLKIFGRWHIEKTVKLIPKK